MSDRHPPNGPPSVPEKDRDLAQLLGLAGTRPPLPMDRALRIRAAVEPTWELESRTFRRGRRLRRGFVLAIAATLALGVGAVLWRQAVPPPQQPAAQLARFLGEPASALRSGVSVPLLLEQRILTGEALKTKQGSLALDLVGGGSLRVGPDTELRFETPTEVVLTRGRLYLDSDDTPDRILTPLSVRTHLGTVEEIGTQFEVDLTAEAIRVRVREGEVHLHRPFERIQAVAREEIRLNAGGELTRSAVATYGPMWSWTEALAVVQPLDGQELGRFLQWVSQETGWSISYATDSLAQRAPRILIHGLKDELGPREALRPVLAACELGYRYENGVVTLDIAGR